MARAVSRLRVFLTLHLAVEAIFLLPLIYTSWVLETLSDDPGLIATYLVLVVSVCPRPCPGVCLYEPALSRAPVVQGGIEHTVCSCMVLISLCTVICPCCRDVDHALKAVRGPARLSSASQRACILVVCCLHPEPRTSSQRSRRRR